MKRLIFTLLIILIGVAVLFNVLDSKSEYVAEKSLYRINKEYAELAKDPKSSPEATFSKVIGEYEEFIKKYSYSKTIPAAKLYIARMYRIQENHTKARTELEKIISEYKNDSVIAVQALIDLGISYEADNDINSILKIYKRIQSDYPLTTLGINAPLLIAQLYTKENDLTSANLALDNAIIYYQQLIQKHPKSEVEANSLRLLATAYTIKRQWLNSVKTLMGLLDRYPNSQSPENFQNITRTINSISIMQLKNYDLPINFYQKFISTHPNHPYNESFIKIIEKIKEFKAQTQTQQQQNSSPSNGNKN